MDVETVVRDAFVESWERYQPSPRAKDYFRESRDQVFDLGRVQRFVDQDIRGASSPETRERYHLQTLRHLAQLYAQTLYKFSKGDPDSRAMREAIQQLKFASACPYYPCLRE
jgi:hypothetical protein